MPWLKLPSDYLSSFGSFHPWSFLAIVFFFTDLRSLHHQHQDHSLTRQESAQGKTSFSSQALSLSGKDEPSLGCMPMSQGHHITHSGERGLGSPTLELLICVT